MSNNLGWNPLAENGANPEAEVNEAFERFDGAMSADITIDVTGGNGSLTLTEVQTNVVVDVIGASVTRDVVLPIAKRVLYVTNAGSAVVTIKRGTASVPIPANGSAIIHLDGSTNGLRPLGSVTSGDGGTDPGTGNGLPPGGTTGQVLKKQSDDDYDVDWSEDLVGTGGGGGGDPGTPGQTPLLVQKATLRNDGNVVLANDPTPGNLLVWLTGGFGESLGSYALSGFTGLTKYQSNSANAVQVFARKVKTGDGKIWAASANDNQGGVLYEFSSARGVFGLGGGPVSMSGDNFKIGLFPPPFSGFVNLLALTHDNATDFVIQPNADATTDFISAAAQGNHTGAFVRATANEMVDNVISGSVSSPAQVCFGIYSVYG